MERSLAPSAVYMQTWACMQTARVILILFAGLLCAPISATTLRINGSTTVNPPVAEAAEILRRECGMAIQVDTQGGSSGGISSLGDGLAEIGMVSKPLTEADRKKYPEVSFTAHHIGEDAVALVVSRDVWEGGVRSLSAEQMRGIYEGRVRNWSDLGGPNRRIAFFNKEPGRGTWEVFAAWLYGHASKAPSVSWPEVGGNEEARNKVASTRGALSQLSVPWADGRRLFALAIQLDDGSKVAPTPENLANRRYPLARPLLLLTDGEPASEARVFIDFLLGPRGQEIIRRHGFLPPAADTP